MKKLWLHKYCVNSNLFAMIAVLCMQLRGNSRIYRVCISKENSKTEYSDYTNDLFSIQSFSTSAKNVYLYVNCIYLCKFRPFFVSPWSSSKILQCGAYMQNPSKIFGDCAHITRCQFSARMILQDFLGKVLE